MIEYILEETVTRKSSIAETQDQSQARSSASSLEDDVRDESGNQVTNTPISSQSSLQSTSTPLTTTVSTLDQHPVDSSTGTLHSEEASSTISQQLADNPSTYIIPQQLSLILSAYGKPTISQATDHCVT
jgi:iron uptake system EfeUOB component EfeO/EfeM